MLSTAELMEKLDAAFPDKASMMSGMNEAERVAYIAQVELVNTIKMWNEPRKENK